MGKTIDLTGRRFGRLTVLSKSPERYVSPGGRTSVRWHCKCDCGREVDILGRSLLHGKTVSCGCYQKAIFAGPKKFNLTGRRFGKVLVVERCPEYFVFPSGQKAVQWKCKCFCGKEFNALERALLKGTVKSCGCVWRCNIK